MNTTQLALYAALAPADVENPDLKNRCFAIGEVLTHNDLTFVIEQTFQHLLENHKLSPAPTVLFEVPGKKEFKVMWGQFSGILRKKQFKDLYGSLPKIEDFKYPKMSYKRDIYPEFFKGDIVHVVLPTGLQRYCTIANKWPTGMQIALPTGQLMDLGHTDIIRMDKAGVQDLA